MPPPRPLTACEPPQLDWSRPGIPAATNFGDIYFSVDGGLTETESVYLAGCGLPDRWHESEKKRGHGRERFTIGELGFGSGLNFLAAWRMWDASGPKNAHLHFVSVEKFPFSREELKRALTAWPELASYSKRLLALWPGRVKGTHRLHVSDTVTLTLLHDDVTAALKDLTGNIDAWFLDGFSPAKNPAMWSKEVMADVARLSAPGATIGTFTVAGAVREALKDAGFAVEKKEGFGRKRQRLEAVFPGSYAEKPQDIRPIILGSGIAGASLARSFQRRGITATIIDPSDNTAASANPAALVKPRLDQQDRPESRFFLESYLYALREYNETNAVIDKGVFHAATTEKEMQRFKKLAELAALPPEHMVCAGGPYSLKGLNFPSALVIDPAKACAAFLKDSVRVNARAHAIENKGGEWQIYDRDHNLLASGTHVILALGAGMRDFQSAPELPLRYSRGQITMANTALASPFTYGGYAIPLKEGGAENLTLIGATHARLTKADPYRVTAEDDAENLFKFTAITGETPTPISGNSRASIRVTQANTLPLIHDQGNGIISLTALGSRGFCFAPALAENIVLNMCEDPHVMGPFWDTHT